MNAWRTFSPDQSSGSFWLFVPLLPAKMLLPCLVHRGAYLRSLEPHPLGRGEEVYQADGNPKEELHQLPRTALSLHAPVDFLGSVFVAHQSLIKGHLSSVVLLHWWKARLGDLEWLQFDFGSWQVVLP